MVSSKTLYSSLSNVMISVGVEYAEMVVKPMISEKKIVACSNFSGETALPVFS